MKLKTLFSRVGFHLKNKTLMPSFLRFAFESRLRFMVNRQPYLFFYNKWVQSKAKKTIYPDSINIETVNICNARCVFCPRDKLTRKKGIMSDEVFEKVISRIKEEKIPIKSVCLNGFGEPMLDQKIFDKIKYIKRNLNVPVIFFTNGQLFDEKKVKMAFESGVDEINVSFNAMFKEDYEKVMGISYDKTVKNIETFIRMRKERKASKPKLYISCVYSKKYKFDKKKFLSRWTKVVDSVYVMPAEVFGNLNKDEAFPVSEYGYVTRKWACSRLWRNAWISIEGKIHICCKDTNGEIIMGDLTKDKFMDVWNSKKFKAVREAHLSGKYDNISLCKDCEVLVRSSTGWWF
jgi:radical SAM protein with 4Fe4S-binding SPASM domain